MKMDQKIAYCSTSNSTNSNVRGQPSDNIISDEEKKLTSDIKKQIKKSIDKNPKFKQFLKENNAYGRYVKNVVKYIKKRNNPKTSVMITDDTIQECNNPSMIIHCTLAWRHTTEGEDYWRNLYYKAHKNK